MRNINPIVLKTGHKVPIQPGHVNTDQHFWNAFDNRETEDAARRLVISAKRRGNWEPFTIADIGPGFDFGRLVAQEWIFKKENGEYYFTLQFVARCWGSSPAPLE